MGRRFEGNRPCESEGWVLMAVDIDDGDDGRWLVYRRDQENSPDWGTYKIVADGRAEGKANYWLVRNDRTGQIGLARDFAIMREVRPRLHAAVERVFLGT